MIDLVGKRHFYYILSILIMVPGLISLAIPPSLRPGIEFSSGSSFRLSFAEPSRVSQDALSAELDSLGYSDSRVQTVTGEPGTYIIRTKELQGPAQGTIPELDRLEGSLRSAFGNLTEGEFRPSGTSLVLRFEKKGAGVTPESLAAELATTGYPESKVTQLTARPATFAVVLARVLAEPSATPASGPAPPTEVDVLLAGLRTKFGEVTREALNTGSQVTLTFSDASRVTAEQLSAEMESVGYAGSRAFSVEDDPGTYILLTKPIQPRTEEAPSELGNIEKALRGEFGDLTRDQFSSVSAIVSERIVRNAAFAVLAATVAILLYISWAFRSVTRPFRYGIAAIVALVHDVIVVLGTYSILGKFLGFEVNTMFITALLTVIGFSVHDTIVVFDRVRENLKRSFGVPFAEVVNNSLNETIGRSLNTSMTVVFTLWALLLIGGVTIRSFLVVLLIGIISGTYSSIAVASQVLVSWETGEFGRWFRKITFRGARPEPQVAEPQSGV